MSMPDAAYLTPADLLARGLALQPVAERAVDLPPGTCCTITGQPIGRGYRVADMVTGATAEFLDCFRGGVHGHVSEAAARCFRSANPRTGNPCARALLIFEDGTAFGPLINRSSALAQGRPCWSDLVRAVWPERQGQRCLAILTTDTKKRLWIRARVGALGPRTPILYYDGKMAGNEVLLVDWPALLSALHLVEQVYQIGFPKATIADGLYAAGKVAQAVGLAEVRRHERALAPWRGTAEFRVALLIGQRQEGEGRS